MEGTFWSLLPPVVAIVFALITKKVYFSLLLGILSGALMLSDFVIFGESGAIESIISTMASNVGDSYNFALLIFLVLLGMLVQLMTKAGGTVAYGNWAGSKIKSQRQALFATSALGVMIFVDDYFNCLTVGTIMRPVTDRFNISRAKLAYIIDATAAPVCIIAPISSWGAAVASQTEGTPINGFTLLLRTIPVNLYALLTIMMIIILVGLKFDFGPMKNRANRSMVSQTPSSQSDTTSSAVSANPKGKVMDLVLPIVVLIASCVFFMVYTGGIFDGANIVDAFANCNAAVSLTYGAIFTLLFTFLLYIPRKVASIKDFSDSFVDGFKSMLPAILILMLAWTLKSTCQNLEIGKFVSSVVSEDTLPILLPSLCFLVALGIAFATGTSWGTFGILVPIVCAIAGYVMTDTLVLTTAAVLAGAVCGDHISPISDTTILASTGAQCDHLEHVSTQMPYALIVAGCSLFGYLVAGLTNSLWLCFISGAAALIVVLLSIYFAQKRKSKLTKDETN